MARNRCCFPPRSLSGCAENSIKNYGPTNSRRGAIPRPGTRRCLDFDLGTKPQAIVTTTPRPTKLMRDLLADPLTYTTQHSTFENVGNLAENFLDARGAKI